MSFHYLLFSSLCMRGQNKTISGQIVSFHFRIVQFSTAYSALKVGLKYALVLHLKKLKMPSIIKKYIYWQSLRSKHGMKYYIYIYIFYT